MNESNIIEWPEAFYGNDSQAWRNIKEYDLRMEQIAWYACMNFQILKESSK